VVVVVVKSHHGEPHMNNTENDQRPTIEFKNTRTLQKQTMRNVEKIARKNSGFGEARK